MFSSQSPGPGLLRSISYPEAWDLDPVPVGVVMSNVVRRAYITSSMYTPKGLYLCRYLHVVGIIESEKWESENQISNLQNALLSEFDFWLSRGTTSDK